MTEFNVPRDSRRVPLATRVQLKFEWFSGFISEYSSNISPGGMFIRTQTPEPPGRVLGFEFRLGDGFELIQGTGEVMWVRPLDESPEKPAGMGIRFLEISPQGRELIVRMVENYIRDGGTPFDVANAPAPVPAPPDSIPAAPPASAPAAAPPPRPSPVAAAPTPRPAPSPMPQEPRPAVSPPPPRAASPEPPSSSPPTPAMAPIPPPPVPPVPQAPPRPAPAAPLPAMAPVAAPAASPSPLIPAPKLEPMAPVPAPRPEPVPSATLEPPPRGAAQPSSWTSILAGATAPAAEPASPALAIPEPAPERAEEGAGRSIHLSRIVLWGLLAAFLGAAGWIAMRQDLLSRWLPSSSATTEAPPAPSARRAAHLRRKSVPAAAAATPADSAAQAASAAQAHLPAVPPVAQTPAPPAPTPAVAATAAPPPPAPAAAAASPTQASSASAPPIQSASASASPTESAASSAVSSGPLTEIEKITWQESPGGTEVVLWGNGAFRRQDFAHYRVDGDPPRVLVKLRGIRRPFAEGRLIVGTRQVRQVRTGYHIEGGGNELHVVLDLAGFGVEVTGMQEDASKLHIFLKGT